MIDQQSSPLMPGYPGRTDNSRNFILKGPAIKAAKMWPLLRRCQPFSFLKYLKKKQDFQKVDTKNLLKGTMNILMATQFTTCPASKERNKKEAKISSSRAPVATSFVLLPVKAKRIKKQKKNWQPFQQKLAGSYFFKNIHTHTQLDECV